MVWLNLSPIPVGRRGVISSYNWCLPVFATRTVEEGRRESAPCVCSRYRCTTCLRSGGESGGGGVALPPLALYSLVSYPQIHSHTPPFSNLRHLIANSVISDNFGNFLRRLAFAKVSVLPLYIGHFLCISAGTALPYMYNVHPQWRHTIILGGFCSSGTRLNLEDYCYSFPGKDVNKFLPMRITRMKRGTTMNGIIFTMSSLKKTSWGWVERRE